MTVETDNGVLQAMMEEGYACNVEKGWFQPDPRLQEFQEWFANRNGGSVDLTVMGKLEEIFGPRTVGDDLALLHSEISEMLEAYRDGGLDDQTEESDVHPDAPSKPEGFGAEAADVLVRLLDTCKRRNVDLFYEWRRKMTYNWTRPARHGGKAL